MTIEATVAKLYQDIYEGPGNGVPSLTSRIFLMEDQLAKINKNLSKLVWLVAATLASTVAQYFLKGVH